MKVLLRVRQPPSSHSQNSVSTSGTTATAPPLASPTTALSPRSSSTSGSRPTTTTASAATAATTSTTTSTTSTTLSESTTLSASSNTTTTTAEPSGSFNSTSDPNLSNQPTSTSSAASLTLLIDCPTSSSLSIIAHTTLDSTTSSLPVTSVPPVVSQAAIPPSRSTASVSNELSSSLGEVPIHHVTRNTNGNSESTHTNRNSGIAAIFNPSSNPSSTSHTRTTTATPPKPRSEPNHEPPTTTSTHNATANQTIGPNRSELPVPPTQHNKSIRESLEYASDTVPSHDCTSTSHSTTARRSTTAAIDQRILHTSGIEHKRKTSRIHTLEIESKLPPAIGSSDSATTRSAAHEYENLSSIDKRPRKMGQFYRSEGGGRVGDNPIGGNNITTIKSSSSSLSSSSSSPSSIQHRMRLQTNERKESNAITTDINPATSSLTLRATTTTITTITSQQNKNPVNNHHQLVTTSSYCSVPPRVYSENHKFPASTTAEEITADAVVEEELDEGKGVEEEEVVFQAALKKRGLEMVEQKGDGNCLFRAVSLQVYGDAEVHMDVRRRCLDFMSKDEAHFSEFVVDEPFMQYILRKRQNGVHGNNPEIQAISELYNRPVEVFVPSNGAIPINIFQAAYKTCDAPLRLSYHDGNHYNAVTDPLCPTAGLGLGLPGLEPGLADRMQMEKAVDESEGLHVDKVARESHEMEVQKAIVESKRDSGSKGFGMYYKQKAALMASDIEATDFELEQAALVDSLKSHFSNDAGQKQPWNHNRQHKQQHSRDRRWYQGGQFSSASSTRFPEISSTSSAMRSRAHSSASSSLVASLPSAASATVSSQEGAGIPTHLLNSSNSQDDEYPQTVQELVMNGFPLERVVKAYNLIGDNFDDLLAYLMSSGNGS